MAKLDPAAARTLVSEAMVGRLATVTASHRPHVVPCCFALIGERIYSAVDSKPKSTSALKRLDNVSARPAASLIVDHYADDWQELWWVRVDGSAGIVEVDDERESALDALAAKYRQYRSARPEGAVLRIDIEGWTSWAFDPAAVRR